MSDSFGQPEQNSILDRVLSSQHAQAIEGFVPTEIFTSLTKALSDKERDVLRRRFGMLGNGDIETLEEIGKRYHVTRERIRQIENGAIRSIKHERRFRDTIQPVERLLANVITAHGGAVEERSFFNEILVHAGNTVEQERALSFILHQLLLERIERYPGDATVHACWKLRAQSLDLVQQAIHEFIGIVSDRQRPLQRDELLTAFKGRPLYSDHVAWFTPEVLQSYLQLAVGLGRNPFDEYGLRAWGSIAPKRMNDKIYLIMKKHGQPLHFTEITQRINDAGFDKRRAYPPTVHNELILNDQYVLVGRGIYALREWGYKPGVVADVIGAVLREHGGTMERDELLREVLRQRMVKRNTVLLALTNKQRFRRLPNGSYTLVDQVAPAAS